MKRIVVHNPRPLPVIVLADASYSMSEDLGASKKIDALNHSIQEMIAGFADVSRESNRRGEIHLAVIAFGGTAHLHTPLQPASAVSWEDLKAVGGTPLGDAISLATDILLNPLLVPTRAFTPALVVVSDGKPTDDWRTPLERLKTSERCSDVVRLALLVGAAADRTSLEEFVGNSKIPVFRVNEAEKIEDYFRWVTRSVTHRFRSGLNSEIEDIPDELAGLSLKELLLGTTDTR